jgi:transcriptional regulator with XRE-family HTH domain
MLLNEKIQALRKERGLSQEKVADALNVSRQAVSKWETGQSNPDTGNLIALAELFGCSADELIGTTKAPEKKRKSKWPAVLTLVVMAAISTGATWDSISSSKSHSSSEDAYVVVPPEPSDSPVISVDGSISSDSSVYASFTALQKGNLSVQEEYTCRETIYRGLETLDWVKYGKLGEAGHESDTIFSLLRWLASQKTLSSGEITCLQRGCCRTNLDGAYTDEYTVALANALQYYPEEFCEALSAVENTDKEKQIIISLTEYGAQVPEERLRATLDALHHVIYGSGALNNDSMALASQIYRELGGKS